MATALDDRVDQALVREFTERSTELSRGEFKFYPFNKRDTACMWRLESAGYLSLYTTALGTTAENDGEITSIRYGLSEKGLSALKAVA